MMGRKTTFFTPEEGERIEAAIEAAERETSGEICVHLQNFCWGDPYRVAQKVFRRLGMTETRDRNGILFFILPKKRKFVILGDEGIHQKVTQAFWDALRDRLHDKFQHGQILDGVLEVIALCGEKLKNYFPCLPTDVNELKNTISYR